MPKIVWISSMLNDNGEGNAKTMQSLSKSDALWEYVYNVVKFI